MVRQRQGTTGATETLREQLGRWGSAACLPLIAAAVISRMTHLIVASSGDDMVVGDVNKAEDPTILFTDVGDTSTPVLFILGGDSRLGDPIVNGIEAWAGNTGIGIVGNGDFANDGNGVAGFATGNGTGVSGEGEEGNGPGVTGFGGRSSGPGVVGHGGGGQESNADGVQGFGFGKGFGVIGHGGFAAGTGVIGFGGLNGQGVAGIGTGTAPGVVGVAGDFSQRENADGVQGFGAGTGVGTVGRGGASNGAGVLGFGGGRRGPGVVGIGGNLNKENTADGVQGFGQGTFSGVAGWGGGKSGAGIFGAGGSPDGTGVHGQGTGNGVGVVGVAAGNHGIFGTTTRTNFGGVYGLATATMTAGIYGSTVDPTTTKNVATAYAGYFDGNMVAVHGTKSAAVPHPDGSYRLLYCMESPESWFEDFGESTLTHGRAEVRLDPDFAAVIETSGYHVFLTPHSIESETLAVTQRRADAFVVMERNKGAGDGGFSWRLVARRKDVVAARLAKVELMAPTTPPALPNREAMTPAHHAAEAHALPERVQPPKPRTSLPRPQRRAKPSTGAPPRE